MSQQIIVDKTLKFKGRANIDPNIEGNASYKKLVISDDFTGAALDAGRWVFAGDNGGTEAIAAGTNGTVTLTTGATNDDRSIIASPLIFLCAKNPVIEARVKVSAATLVGINFGFNDATTEGNDALAAEITAAAMVNAKSTDCAMFIYDTDATIDHLYVGATDTDVEGAPVLAQAVGYAFNGTGYLQNGARIQMLPGSTVLTMQTTGTLYIELPVGCTGTLTDGTGTFTGSVISLTAGLNTIACTAAGTATVVWGRTPGTTYQTWRVGLDSGGNATFWVNGEAVGRLADCVTKTAPLCAFLGVITRTTAARVLTVDYIRAWQDR